MVVFVKFASLFQEYFYYQSKFQWNIQLIFLKPQLVSKNRFLNLWGISLTGNIRKSRNKTIPDYWNSTLKLNIVLGYLLESHTQVIFELKIYFLFQTKQKQYYQRINM